MLPIGLGVFGGISVIAIVVVGIVTYERTKHRRVRVFGDHFSIRSRLIRYIEFQKQEAGGSWG